MGKVYTSDSLLETVLYWGINCIFAQMYKFLVEKYVFTIFAYEFFKVKMKYCK